MQIFSLTKFGLNLTPGSKVMAKKFFTFNLQKVNFQVITFEPVVRLSPNFESEKICMIHGLFAKAVCRKQMIHLGEKRSTWARMSCIFYPFKMCSMTPQFSSTWCEAFVYVSRFFVMCVNCCYIQFTSLAKVNVNVTRLCKKILW